MRYRDYLIKESARLTPITSIGGGAIGALIGYLRARNGSKKEKLLNALKWGAGGLGAGYLGGQAADHLWLLPEARRANAYYNDQIRKLEDSIRYAKGAGEYRNLKNSRSALEDNLRASQKVLDTLKPRFYDIPEIKSTLVGMLRAAKNRVIGI